MYCGSMLTQHRNNTVDSAASVRGLVLQVPRATSASARATTKPESEIISRSERFKISPTTCVTTFQLAVTGVKLLRV